MACSLLLLQATLAAVLCVLRPAAGSMPPPELQTLAMTGLLHEAKVLQAEFEQLPPGMRKLMQAGVATAVASNNAQLNQLAIIVAQLRIIADAIGLASGVLSIVYGAMSTMSSAIAVGLSDYTRTTSPAIFYISAYNFEQTLYGDFNRLIDSSDYLGDAAKYIKLYNKLRDTLGTDGSAWVQQQMGQLSDVLNVVNTTAPALNNTLQMMAGLPL